MFTRLLGLAVTEVAPDTDKGNEAMRKLIAILAFATFSICGFAQAGWSCQALTDDVARWNEIKAPVSSKNKKAAEALSKEFGLNSSGKLSVDYVIQCTDSIGEDRIMNAVEAWLAELFPNADNSLLASNKKNNSVVVRGMSLGKVGEAADLFSVSVINATFEVEIYVKVNRVRIIMRSNQYKVVKYMNGSIVQNYTIAMSDTYPFNLKSDHKDSYAMAYINTYAAFFNDANWLVKYLNTNAVESSAPSAVGDDW